MSARVSSPRLRGREQVVPLKSIHPAPWKNWNVLTPRMFGALKASIAKHGQVRSILVREVGKEFGLINGTHTWTAMSELGAKRIQVRNLGKLGDAEAKRVAIATNELHGDPDAIALDAVVADLLAEFAPADLADLPFELDGRTPSNPAPRDRKGAEVASGDPVEPLGADKTHWHEILLSVSAELHGMIVEALEELSADVRSNVPTPVKYGLAAERLVANWRSGQ